MLDAAGGSLKVPADAMGLGFPSPPESRPPSVVSTSEADASSVLSDSFSAIFGLDTSRNAEPNANSGLVDILSICNDNTGNGTAAHDGGGAAADTAASDNSTVQPPAGSDREAARDDEMVFMRSEIESLRNHIQDFDDRLNATEITGSINEETLSMVKENPAANKTLGIKMSKVEERVKGNARKMKKLAKNVKSKGEARANGYEGVFNVKTSNRFAVLATTDQTKSHERTGNDRLKDAPVQARKTQNERKFGIKVKGKRKQKINVKISVRPWSGVRETSSPIVRMEHRPAAIQTRDLQLRGCSSICLE